MRTFLLRIISMKGEINFIISLKEYAYYYYILCISNAMQRREFQFDTSSTLNSFTFLRGFATEQIIVMMCNNGSSKPLSNVWIANSDSYNTYHLIIAYYTHPADVSPFAILWKKNQNNGDAMQKIKFNSINLQFFYWIILQMFEQFRCDDMYLN